MIGNDIIDLNLAEKENDWQREGFLKKQFTKEEQSLILKARNSFEMVWTLWSMKEAAYKIWAQQNKKRMFAPLKFECVLTSEDEGFVSFQNQKVYTNTLHNEFYIYTIACLEKDSKAYSEIGPPFGIDDRIKKKLEKDTGISASGISQRKSIHGAPSYYYRNQRLIKSCSISHHGNYGAFSLLLT